MTTPKFKEGDWIKRKKDGLVARVIMLLKECYGLNTIDGEGWWLDYDYQDTWEVTDSPCKPTKRVYFDNHTAHFNFEKRNEDDIEYIPKDALLNWAKDALEDEQIKGRAAKGEKFVDGYLTAMKDLVHDIEEKWL